MTNDAQTLHLISDSTGETLHAMIRAALARFPDFQPALVVSVFVRSVQDLEEAIVKVRDAHGLVLYTLADANLRTQLLDACSQIGIITVPALDPLIDALSVFIGAPPAERPGMQHKINNEYFDRITALDFAIAHDDGALDARLEQADVILTGVSRTSKTPTCIYLAYRGIKAANVPLVPNQQPDPAFFAALDRGVPVIGLTASPSRLSQIRQQRLQALGSSNTSDYAEVDQIRGEVSDARLFFDGHGIPVIDVTRRSIEETAAEILAILREHGIATG
ncbi:MAG: pyruvate, water dikinase regulatory protein [Pseudomonadota bacterium]